MLETANLPLFLAASLALLLAPGPAVLYIIARSIDQGRAAGLVSVLSIEAGNFCHVLAATAGLSALLLSSEVAFALVKYLGAAYLIYLGIRKWADTPRSPETPALIPQSYGSIFKQGVVVAVLNPKTALFFLAFLPQFVEPGRGNVSSQMFSLGILFVLMACVTDSLYALLAGTAGQWLRGSRRFLRGEQYFAASIYMGLGLITVLGEILPK